MGFKLFRRKYSAFMKEANENVSVIKGKVNNLKLNEEGSLSMTAGSIIGFAIALIVLAAVVPDAISTFYGANTSTWQIDGAEDTKTTVLWWLLPLVIVAAVVMMIYKSD